MWSISGLVRITLACVADPRPLVGRGVAVVRRGHEVGDQPLAERCVAGPGRGPWWGRPAAPCRARRRRSTRRSAAGSRATCPKRCRWRPTTLRRWRSASIAPAWCDQRVSTPRPRRRESTRGERVDSAAAGLAARAGSTVFADDPVEVLVREVVERVRRRRSRRPADGVRGGANGSAAPRRRRSRRADESASPVLTRLLPPARTDRQHDVLDVRGIERQREVAHVEQVGDADAVELGVAPERGDEADGVARARVLRLQRLQRRHDQQPLVARAGEVTVVERVPVAGELQRLLAIQVRRPGVEVRAGEVVVHRRRDVDVDPADLVDHLLEVGEVGADHPGDGHADDRRHRVGFRPQVVAAGVVDDVRVELAAARAPRCRAGCRCSVADLSAGFTPITWMASARPGSSGDCDGSSERAPVPRTRAKNGCCGPPVTCAVPTLATWSHTAPCAGTGRPTSSHAVVTMPATSSPHTSGATTSSVMARRRAGVRPLVLWRVTWLLPWSRWTRWSWSGCRDRRPRGSRPCCRR